MTKQSKSKPVTKVPVRPKKPGQSAKAQGAKVEERREKASNAKHHAAKQQPAPQRERKTVARFDWQGVTVAVSYEADWMGMLERHSQFATAHLEIEAAAPPKQMLPVTETGYRSHFVARAIVEQAGGPVAYARAWLDHAAKAPEWKRREQQSRQLCLF